MINISSQNPRLQHQYHCLSLVGHPEPDQSYMSSKSTSLTSIFKFISNIWLINPLVTLAQVSVPPLQMHVRILYKTPTLMFKASLSYIPSQDIATCLKQKPVFNINFLCRLEANAKLHIRNKEFLTTKMQW